MTAIAHQPHPVPRVLAGVRDQLREVAGIPVWSMDATDTTAAIADPGRRGAARRAEVTAPRPRRPDRHRRQHRRHLDRELARHQTKTTRPAAHRALRLATGSRATSRPGRPRRGAGPRRAGPGHRARRRRAARRPRPRHGPEAEEHLVAEAAHHDAKALKNLGRRHARGRRPRGGRRPRSQAAGTRRARRRQAATRLTMWDDGHGKVHGRFTLAP